MTTPHSGRVRATLGGVVGNVLEWYDFAVFGFFAPIIGVNFFPGEDRLAGMIKAFGVFAAGYLMRPLGGIFFGWIGDRLGRKTALMISVLMMAMPTTLLGCLPTYATWGVKASVLLVLIRLVQGVSVGGELIGSVSFVIENAPRERRGFIGSWTLVSAVGGMILGSAVAGLLHAFMEPAALSAWGWRIPFWGGFLVGVFGLWMRSGLSETPDFECLRQNNEVCEHPVGEAMRNYLGRMFHLAALAASTSGGFYMLFIWWPSYLSQIIKPAVPHALFINTLAMLAFMVLSVGAGYLSDKAGRKPVMAASALGLAALCYPLFVFTDYGTFGAALWAQLVFALLLCGSQGALPSAMVEMFPPRVRFTTVALGYNLGMGLVGGTSPLIATWLIEKTGNLAAPAYYLILLGLVSFVAALMYQRYDAHGKES